MLKHYTQINKRLFMLHSTVRIYAKRYLFDGGFQILHIKSLSFVREITYRGQGSDFTRTLQVLISIGQRIFSRNFVVFHILSI
jgi:hypothetical protein